MDQNTETSDELNKKRQDAAKAMSSGFQKSAPQAKAARDSMAIAEQRLRAQVAMEGDERRKRREETARIEKEKIEKARQEEESKKKEEYEKVRLEKEKEAQLQREKEERESIAKQLKQQVDTIRSSGVNLKTIRTLRADTDNLIKSQNISLVGIAIKEEERKRKNQENISVTSGKNLPLALASFVLIILGIGIAVYIYSTFYSGSGTNIISGKINVVESIIFAQKNKILDVTKITTDDLVNRLKNEVRNPPDLLIGEVENLQFTKALANGQQTPIDTSEFLTIVGSHAPDSLVRTLSNKFMFGVLSSAQNAGFIILTTESHNQALAGLLEWEGKSMTEDMYQVLTSLHPDDSLLTKPYEDLVIRNVDTRVLKNADGTIGLVYGFLDGDTTLIIAGNQQAFEEALRRFNTPKPTKQ
ncbi:MAG: hypothetical protein HY226_05725 [Candidatus Vogelbacteria bacterium]|nr:hypothetical protein [Candidatus Vogelbacteria bacterium]